MDRPYGMGYREFVLRVVAGPVYAVVIFTVAVALTLVLLQLDLILWSWP